jgi:hypothetical protein
MLAKGWLTVRDARRRRLKQYLDRRIRRLLARAAEALAEVLHRREAAGQIATGAVMDARREATAGEVLTAREVARRARRARGRPRTAQVIHG